MRALRIVMLALALVTPAVAYRLGGTSLWTAMAAGLTVSAAVAAFALWQDEELVDMLRPRSGDAALGVGGAALVYLVAALVFYKLVAPSGEFGALLRQCGAHGPLLPRTDARGLGWVLESARANVCEAYVQSLGPARHVRAALILAVALLEEVAWRGGVQQLLSERLGSTRGWLAASALYAAAYAATGNWVLAPLALATGLLWGALYRYRGRLAPAILSHAVLAFFLFHQQPLMMVR